MAESVDLDFQPCDECRAAQEVAAQQRGHAVMCDACTAMFDAALIKAGRGGAVQFNFDEKKGMRRSWLESANLVKAHIEP